MKFLLEYIREVVIATVVLLIIGSGILLYQWHKSKKDQEAHAAFALVLEKFENLASSSDIQAWQGVEELCIKDSSKHASTTYASFFKAVLAESLIRQHKHSEAIAALNDAIRLLGTSSPLYYAYSTKLALVKIDSDDALMQEEGKKLLSALANDVRNPQRDVALYYRGLIIFMEQGYTQAIEAWQPLLHDEMAGSLWASVAREHLEYVA